MLCFFFSDGRDPKKFEFPEQKCLFLGLEEVGILSEFRSKFWSSTWSYREKGDRYV